MAAAMSCKGRRDSRWVTKVPLLGLEVEGRRSAPAEPSRQEPTSHQGIHLRHRWDSQTLERVTIYRRRQRCEGTAGSDSTAASFSPRRSTRPICGAGPCAIRPKGWTPTPVFPGMRAGSHARKAAPGRPQDPIWDRSPEPLAIPDWLDGPHNLVWAHKRTCNKAAEIDKCQRAPLPYGPLRRQRLHPRRARDAAVASRA